MKINPSDTNHLALYAALAVLAISLTADALMIMVWGNQVPVWELLFSNLIPGLAAFLLFRLVLEKFVHDKVRIIYKTIRNLKQTREVGKAALSETSLDKVNQQVIEWSETKKREIEELKNMARYRREFLGNISHELKTPIFNIQGYVLTLLDGGLYDESINKEYLLRTEKSINRMIAIVEDLESISQLESSELKLNYARFDLAALAREVVEFMEIKARKRNNQVQFDKPYDKPLFVSADKERVKQVFINLIDNAIKYGHPENGSTTISFFDMDENILVEVTDNGNGIDQADLPRVFERFYRTDKGRSREQGGSGLGLAIVKHIIEAHEQTINVRSTIGLGTTFAFTLARKR